MRKIWWFLGRRTTPTGTLWLFTAAGVAAGIGSISAFVFFLLGGIIFDILTKED